MVVKAATTPERPPTAAELRATFKDAAARRDELAAEAGRLFHASSPYRIATGPDALSPAELRRAQRQHGHLLDELADADVQLDALGRQVAALEQAERQQRLDEARATLRPDAVVVANLLSDLRGRCRAMQEKAHALGLPSGTVLALDVFLESPHASWCAAWQVVD